MGSAQSLWDLLIHLDSCCKLLAISCLLPMSEPLSSVGLLLEVGVRVLGEGRDITAVCKCWMLSFQKRNNRFFWTQNMQLGIGDGSKGMHYPNVPNTYTY